jgi:hypothetical protein
VVMEEFEQTRRRVSSVVRLLAAALAGAIGAFAMPGATHRTEPGPQSAAATPAAAAADTDSD